VSAPLDPRARWALAALVLLLVHGFLLARVAFPGPHSGGDNAAYLSLASALASGEGYVELWDPFEPPHAKYPPAYPLLLALLAALGATTWGAFKALSAVLVAGAALLVLAWAGGRRGLGAGLAVAGLAALSAGWIEASRWVLSEPLFLVGVFGALWGADRAGLAGAGGGGDEGEGGPSTHGAWTAVAAAGALLALFTRTAGLPLLVALLLLLAWRRRFRALAGVAGVSALPVALWVLRGRSAGEGAYQDEFWLANPYDPALGTVGVGGLLVRGWTNLRLYAGEVLGGEWWGGLGAGGGVITALGVTLLLVALAGWGRRLVRREAGLAELFLPLYGGLVLLWPEVWSGDRFVLPLYPLLLFWAGETVAWGVGAVRAPGSREPGAFPRPAPATLACGVLALALALPAAASVRGVAETAERCRSFTRLDPWGCYAPPLAHFRDAAAWAGVNLPEDAVVINRKPRIFLALGGRPGRVFPFLPEAGPLLELADALGARYLLVDRVDGVSAAYLPRIVGSRPAAFCFLREWGDDTALLGILPPEARGPPPGPDDDPSALGIAPCPGGYTVSETEAHPRGWGHQVPVVVSPPSRRLR
jgi:hypothetical protein